MKITTLVDEDFVNYKEPSMFIGFPCCTMKCEKEAGVRCCQNSHLLTASPIDVTPEEIVVRYKANSITRAIVCGGLDPMDSFSDLLALIKTLRLYHCNDPIVIYTGYDDDEITQYIKELKQYPNIIVKFGRYIPNRRSRMDKILGVRLASNNQHAVKIS